MSAQPHGLEPGAVAEEFVWLLLLEQFEAAAGHIDPVELEAFRAQFFAAADELDSPQERAALLALFGGQRLNELRGLTAEQFFVRFMGAASAASRQSVRPPPDVDRGQLRSFWVEETAADGDHAVLDVALVLRLPGCDSEVRRRVGLRRTSGRWRVLLDERLAGMASRIVAKVRRSAN
ncbi:MAG: hypothetical protein JNN27_05235 [Planctomycetes bacterium]|nr:hypothetical protein [Planctomycetota bacterium]